MNFRALLLTRCQREFEKDKDTELDMSRRQEEIDKAETVILVYVCFIIVEFFHPVSHSSFV